MLASQIPAMASGPRTFRSWASLGPQTSDVLPPLRVKQYSLHFFLDHSVLGSWKNYCFRVQTALLGEGASSTPEGATVECESPKSNGEMLKQRVLTFKIMSEFYRPLIHYRHTLHRRGKCPPSFPWRPGDKVMLKQQTKAGRGSLVAAPAAPQGSGL